MVSVVFEVTCKIFSSKPSL